MSDMRKHPAAPRDNMPSVCRKGGGGKGGSMPAPPPPPPPKEPVKMADERVQKAGQDERRRAAAATGRSGTILTSGQGAAGQANTAGKTLLGQ